jgi:GntR family transcriptional repressor for pyruvate dehydrogenase complex
MLLSKSVEAKIEEVILSKKLSPGSKLPSEQQMCNQFGVSRTAIREALRMLSGRGLVKILKGKGIFVNNPTAETVTDPLHVYLHLLYEKTHVFDVIHARQMIEPAIAAAAALNHTNEDALKLKRDLDDLINCSDEHAELSRLDMLFHLDIARASENPIVPLIIDPIHRLMPKIKSDVYVAVRDAKGSAVEWHTKILNAILQRDPRAAREAMEQHLKIAEEHIRTTYATK